MRAAIEKIEDKLAEALKDVDRWHKIPSKLMPKDGVIVQLVVTMPLRPPEVVPGHFNKYRGLWFTGERPVHPSHWRPMAKLPRGVK